MSERSERISGRGAPCLIAAPSARVDEVLRPAPWRMLAVLLCGQAMASMDTSIVTVALPSIRDRLPATGAQAQLVSAAYLLTFAAVVVTGARLGDRYGAARMFRLGLAAFTAASLGCGLAPGPGMLIGARAVQGVAAAVLVPQVVSLIQARFDGPARARAIGLYSMVLAVGVAAGQIAGGLIVSADVGGLGWRPALLVNLPVGLVLLVAAGRLLPADPPPAVSRLDSAGVVLLAGSMAAVVGGLTLGREHGSPSPGPGLWACWPSSGTSDARCAPAARPCWTCARCAPPVFRPGWRPASS
jgi:MFS family permease